MQEEKTNKRKPRKLPKIISREDANKMLDAVNQKCPTGLRNRVILEVMYRAGLRVGEACKLAPPDIDTQKGHIYVQLGKGKKDRVVPIDTETVEFLERWNEIRPESEYFFCTLKGKKLQTRYIRQVTYQLSDKTGVFIQDGLKKKKVSPHVFRHCYATELLEEGFNIVEIKKLLGHVSINATMIYAEIRDIQLTKKIHERQRRA